MIPPSGHASIVPLNQVLELPRTVDRSGLRLTANYLFDVAKYSIGVNSTAAFNTFYDRVLNALGQCKDFEALASMEAFASRRALLLPDLMNQLEALEVKGLKPEALWLVPWLDGDSVPIAQRPGPAAHWAAKYDAYIQDGNPVCTCLITGRPCTPLRLHPKTQNVPGTGGKAPFMSWNESIYQFDGREQGMNWPVSARGGIGYVAGLDHMLESVSGKRAHRSAIGLSPTTTALIWSAGSSVEPILNVIEPDFVPKGAKLASVVDPAWDTLKTMTEDSTDLYFLVLQGSMGRVSVIDWRESTVGCVASNLLRFRNWFNTPQTHHVITFDHCFGVLEDVTHGLPVGVKVSCLSMIMFGGMLPKAVFDAAVRRIHRSLEPQIGDCKWEDLLRLRCVWTSLQSLQE
jgi:hypothetical protein